MEKPEVVCDFLNLMNDELQSRVSNDIQELQKMKDLELPYKQVITKIRDIY